MCVCVCAYTHMQLVAAWTGRAGVNGSFKRQRDVLERVPGWESATLGLCPGSPRLGDLALSDILSFSESRRGVRIS